MLHRELKNLDVGGNDIGPKGAKALCDSLKGAEALRLLELGYNPLGPEGARIVSETFMHDSKVETLKLGWCKIGEFEGARAVADLIRFNQSIVQVSRIGSLSMLMTGSSLPVQAFYTSHSRLIGVCFVHMLCRLS